MRQGRRRRESARPPADRRAYALWNAFSGLATVSISPFGDFAGQPVPTQIRSRNQLRREYQLVGHF